MSPKQKTRLPKSLPFFWFLIFAVLFSLQIFPRWNSDSPTNDEVIDISDGYYFWKGDVFSDSRHPPLPKALQALPLHSMDIVSHGQGHFDNYERRDFNFLYVLNPDCFQTMTAWARSVTLLFGIGIGLLLFLITRGQLVLALTALTLWAFEPTFLAFSGLALADVPVTFFFLAAVYAYQKFRESKSWKGFALTGLFTAMAITSKFSAVLLIPIFLTLEFYSKGKSKPFAWRWGIGVLAAAVWISLLYLPGTLLMPDHRFPLLYFWDGFTAMLSFSGHPTYFLGELSRANHLLYYPLALVLKSGLALTILLLAALWLGYRGKLDLPLWQWLPGLVYFMGVMPFHNIGIREQLPAYPFFILLAAGAAQFFWNRKGRGGFAKKALTALLLLQVLDVALSFPGHISYFNPLVPNDKKAYWLGDSNLDIGQDVKRLAQTAKERGWKNVKLAYFGPTDPALYGMNWSYWTKKDIPAPQPGWVYAVNQGFLQLGPAFMPGILDIYHCWLKEGMKPTGKVGDTWIYYEIPGKADLSDQSAKYPSAPPFEYYRSLNQPTKW